jgi:LEA14-like dessication related protein
MKKYLISGIFLLLTLFLLIAGCMEPPIKEPTVTVSDIAFSDLSLKTMTVNTTVTLFNPNPVGAKLNKVAFDVFYLDDTQNYLGHGEQTNSMVINNGNTTVTIPVTMGTMQALGATGSLVRKGSITLNVNGSAFIDVKVTSFEKRFEQTKTIPLSDLGSFLPLNTLPGTFVNVTDKFQQLGGLVDAVSG